MLLHTESSQLVLIDWQTKLLPALAGGAQALHNTQRLAQAAQLLRVPTSLTEQYPQGLGPTVPELAGLVREPLQKTSFNACDAGLAEHLHQLGTPKASPNAKSVPKHLQKPPANRRDCIVLAGCEAHICVLQTAMGLMDEFEVFVVTDACASRTDRNRDAAYDRLAAEGAHLVTVEMVLFEWLGDAGHEQFKAVQGLVR
jgi:nicotinamidase-related amidase